MPKNTTRNSVRNPIFSEVFVQGEDLTDELAELLVNLKIDPNNLAEEMQEHPLLFARWAVLAEEAASAVYFLKRKKDLREADLDKEIRQDFADEGIKPTEGRISSMIESHPDIVTLNEEYLEADRSARILNVVRQSMSHRREMLVELARDQRKEYKGYDSP